MCGTIKKKCVMCGFVEYLLYFIVCLSEFSSVRQGFATIVLVLFFSMFNNR